MKIETEITWGISFRVWWHIFWRSLFFAFLAGAGVGFLLGFVLALTGAPPLGASYNILIGSLTGILAGIWVVRNVLRKKNRIGKYRLVLLKETDEMTL